MPTPFSFSGSFNLPGTAGLPDQPIPVNCSGSYNKKAEFEFDLSGSGSQTVNLGNIISPGAKLLVVQQLAVSGALPILVKPNSSVTPLEVAPGGFIVWSNPSPATGLTALSFDYTASTKVLVWVLG